METKAISQETINKIKNLIKVAVDALRNLFKTFNKMLSNHIKPTEKVVIESRIKNVIHKQKVRVKYPIIKSEFNNSVMLDKRYVVNKCRNSC